MKRTILYGMLLVLFGLAACTKDETGEFRPAGEGESTLSATVDFRPLTTGLARTRTAGDAVKRIDNLCVLFYGTDRKLAFSRYLTEGEGEGHYVLTDEKRTEAGIAEAETPRASFEMPVPYGCYYIYAVANMGDVANDPLYETAAQTVDGLKAIRLEWQSDDIGANDQMFGFFDDETAAQGEAGTVRIDGPRKSLHAWLRRAVSKVTVAYDASKLKDNVFLYIHSVQIKDIPSTCFLGQKNTAAEGGLIEEGEMCTYTGVALDHERRGLYLSNGPNTDSGGSDHGEREPASLFFFENMQTARGPLKYQDKTGDNQTVTYPDSWKPEDEYYKDSVRYGTYVEVKGYYVSDNPDRVGHGAITYRFMLGKDTERNYEAERNHHYKLTLRFNGFANDVDWHIEYIEPDPGVYVRTPQYISYIYDRTMTAHVKVVGEIVGDLKAEILSNNWWPDDAVGGSTENAVYYWDSSVASELKKPENGFLSLRRTTQTVIGAGASYNSTVNHDSYYDKAHPRYMRSYVPTPGPHDEGSEDGAYTVVEQDLSGLNGSPTRTFAVPLYTRARTLTTTRGYSGNNSYVGHSRSAKVRFSALISFGGKQVEYADTVEMIQVHRLVNPKGIWRSADSDAPFSVRLKYLDGEDASLFSDVVSDGPWRAEIARGDWFTLEPEGDSEAGEDGTIVGRDHTAVTFRYRPKDAPGGKTVRCGVIRVYYHNYNCVHLIFVRQGYEPLALVENGARWHTYNVGKLSVAAGTADAPETFGYEETADPRDEGSYFKWRQATGLLASNNRTYGWGKDPGGGFALTDGRTGVAWDAVRARPGTSDDAWQIDEPHVRVARYEDYRTLVYDKDTNPHIQYGFGVLYADGAEQTAVSVADAYGYYGDEAGRATRGMRGCFVYNDLTGDNLFFPIGVEGYGRRKDDHYPYEWDQKSPADAYTGVLRYANRYVLYTDPVDQIKYRPMFFDLYRQQGAVYWCCNRYEENTTKTNSAWDINYYTFNFDTFLSNAYGGSETQSDACLMRLVDYD